MDKLIARSSFALLLALGLAACGSEAATSDEMPAPMAAPPEAEDEAPEGDPSVPRAEQTQQPAGATVRQPKSNEPAPKACLDQLKDLGIPFEPTQARGVIDAVTVKGRIGGIMFASEEKTTPAQSPMACEFVLTLNKFAAVLKAKGVDRIGTLGSYCYRCCCSWSETNQCRSLNDPEPTCSNGYSNHSWGRAIDIRYVYTTKGERFDINDAKTWVVSPSSGTCTTGLSKQTGASKFLYEIACDAAKAQVFSTMLTPNHNEAHRNHFHFDIGQSGPAKGFTVKSQWIRLDQPEEGGGCGDE
jgi:hypothetical protein